MITFASLIGCKNTIFFLHKKSDSDENYVFVLFVLIGQRHGTHHCAPCHVPGTYESKSVDIIRLA